MSREQSSNLTLGNRICQFEFRFALCSCARLGISLDTGDRNLGLGNEFEVFNFSVSDKTIDVLGANVAVEPVAVQMK